MISSSTAPPQLHNVVMCVGKENDECTLAQNTDIFAYTEYYINVSYAGNGPFEVHWYHNRTEFTCHTLDFCTEIENGPTYRVRERTVDYYESTWMHACMIS